MQVVRETASQFNNPDNQYGYGIPDFEAAYSALQALGVEDQFLEVNFAIYPNPVNDRFFVSFPVSSELAQFKIYDITGNLLMSGEVTSAENSVTISSLAAGIYIATIESDGAANSFKIIKK